MPKLGYKNKKSKDGPALACCGDEDNIPRLSIRGKNIDLAGLSDIAEVGQKFKAEVELEVVGVQKSDTDDDWGNSVEFKVNEFYKEGVSKEEAKEAEPEKGPAGVPVQKKKKPPSAKEALGDNY